MTDTDLTIPAILDRTNRPTLDELANREKLRWVLDGDTDRSRKIGVPPIGKLPSSINDFRDHLERRPASESVQ